MMIDRLKETPSQTAGPYVHIGTAPQSIGRPALAGQPGPRVKAEGERIIIEGTVFDGAGAPLRDAMLEIWQADGDGRVGPHGLFARCLADFDTGRYRFETVRPGPHRHGQPAHVALLIFARGINLHLHTRIHFPEDRERVATDPDLRRLEPEARETLIAAHEAAGRYRFDVHLQGANETVFFDI